MKEKKMNFESASMEDFNEIQELYWNLIELSCNEPSFPGWEKGKHPSDDFIMTSIVQKELYVIRDEEIIKACAVCNCMANDEYEKVQWQVADRGGNLLIIHALAVRYEYRGCGIGNNLLNNILALAKNKGMEAVHLDVIDNNEAAKKFYKNAGFQYICTQNIFYEVVGNRSFEMYEYVIY